MEMSMHKGQSGEGVKMLQQKLDAWIQSAKGTSADPNLIGLVIDGQFGDNTVVALCAFQDFIGVDRNGFAGETVLGALQLSPGLEADGTSITVGSAVETP
jgi:hypothetical protein